MTYKLGVQSLRAVRQGGSKAASMLQQSFLKDGGNDSETRKCVRKFL